jgi:hypothetical protein
VTREVMHGRAVRVRVSREVLDDAAAYRAVCDQYVEALVRAVTEPWTLPDPPAAPKAVSLSPRAGRVVQAGRAGCARLAAIWRRIRGRYGNVEDGLDASASYD